jgi:subtilisin family serine protease
VTLDVIEQVRPIIEIDPLSFSSTLPVGGIQTDTLTITNQGGDTLNFNLYEVSGTHGLVSRPVDLSIPDSFPANSAIQVDAEVSSQLLFLNQSRLIIYLRGQPDVSAASGIIDRAARVQYVYDQLLKTAAKSNDIYNWLVTEASQPRRLFTANAIAATLNATQLKTVLTFPQVARIGVNGQAEILQNEPASWNWLQSIKGSPNTVEWNIAKIRADQVWSDFDIHGEGAVVGIIDTGVMYNHPALIAQYRGNLGNGDFDHNYNWYDLIGSQLVPYDDNNHGTFGSGVAVGDDGVGNQIGVAPGARWIAVKALDSGGGGTYEDLHAALQWMLAPTDLYGVNPDPSRAPDVVLNMWGLWGGCIPEFNVDLVLLRAANILPVFAPGGEGPGCGLVRSPADSPDALTAGSTDDNDNIAGFSARGPSCFGSEIKPDVVAPGVYIRSSTIDGDYQVWSGTSFSTAHLAGAAALLFTADPNLSLEQLEQTLFDTAVCRQELTCGGDPCPGPNNTFGFGRIDVFEAVSAIIGQPYDIPWLDETTTDGTLEPGESMTISVTFNATGLQPGTYSGGINIESNDPLAPLTTLPITLTVAATCEPIMDLTIGMSTIDPVVGEVVTLTASASGTLPIEFTWDFDDGLSVIGSEVTHVFTTPGFHSVRLTAKNACDWVDMQAEVWVHAALLKFLLPLVGR